MLSNQYRYSEFLHAVRIWRFLKASKRSGVHDFASNGNKERDGAWQYETFQGDLAVECPACPHPDINLPKGWDQEPADTAWIYSLFIALDGNFRLRCKDCKIHEDADLNSGAAYYVNNEGFHNFLSVNNSPQEEV